MSDSTLYLNNERAKHKHKTHTCAQPHLNGKRRPVQSRMERQICAVANDNRHAASSNRVVDLVKAKKNRKMDKPVSGKKKTACCLFGRNSLRLSTSVSTHCIYPYTSTLYTFFVTDPAAGRRVAAEVQTVLRPLQLVGVLLHLPAYSVLECA